MAKAIGRKTRSKTYSLEEAIEIANISTDCILELITIFKNNYQGDEDNGKELAGLMYKYKPVFQVYFKKLEAQSKKEPGDKGLLNMSKSMEVFKVYLESKGFSF